MKRNSTELKRLAREHLHGHYGLSMGAWLVSVLITNCVLGVFSSFLNIYVSLRDLLIYYVVTALVSLISVLFSCGLLCIHLNIARDQALNFTDLFSCFRKRPDRFILLGLLMLGISLACMLPCIFCIIAAFLYDTPLLLISSIFLAIAGVTVIVVATLPLALAYFLLADHEQMGLAEALRESVRLMQGNKGRYFYLQLSFLGWALLGVLSCYIGLLWIQPYMTQTTVEFYRDVTGELDQTSTNLP